jgi:hypothetical protein
MPEGCRAELCEFWTGNGCFCAAMEGELDEWPEPMEFDCG